MMFIWWDSLQKIVPMCIILWNTLLQSRSNMLIHVLTMFVMFLMPMQVIKIEIEYINQFRFNLIYTSIFILLYWRRSQVCNFLLKIIIIIKSSKFLDFYSMWKCMTFVMPIFTHLDLFLRTHYNHMTMRMKFIHNW
jgi:hypothetical protein